MNATVPLIVLRNALSLKIYTSKDTRTNAL